MAVSHLDPKREEAPKKHTTPPPTLPLVSRGAAGLRLFSWLLQKNTVESLHTHTWLLYLMNASKRNQINSCNPSPPREKKKVALSLTMLRVVQNLRVTRTLLQISEKAPPKTIHNSIPANTLQ